MDSEFQKEKVREFFDEDSVRYETDRYTSEYSNCHQYSYLVRMEHVLGLLQEEGKKVLDIGCGPGIYTQELIERGHTITSIDIAPGMIERASKKFSDAIGQDRVSFRVGEIYDLDGMQGYFDVIMCIGVISYIPEIKKFLKQLTSLLKPGGYAVIQISKKYSPKSFDEEIVYPSIQRIKKIIAPRAPGFDSEVILVGYRTGEFDRLCSDSGLIMEEEVHFDYTFPVINILAKRFSLSLARFLENRKNRLIQTLLAGERVARYRKK